MAASVKFRHPWEQQEGESARAFRAFQVYAQLGEGRSHEEAADLFKAQESSGTAAAPERHARTTGNVSGSVKRWSVRFDWHRRAAAYDAHLLSVEAETRLKDEEARRREWVKRDEKRIESTWSIAQQLKLKALEMLRFPLAAKVERVRVLNDDGSVQMRDIPVEPANWALRDLALFLRTANELEQTVLAAVVGKQAEEQPNVAGQVTESVRNEAADGLETWRKEMRGRLLTMPTAPPDDDDAQGHQHGQGAMGAGAAAGG